MSDSESVNEPTPAHRQITNNAGSVALPAAFFLICGLFVVRGGTAGDEPGLALSVTALRWVLIGGSITLFVAAGLCWGGRFFGIVLDALTMTVLAVLLLVVGVGQIAYGNALGYVVIVLAVMIGIGARNGWKEYKQIGALLAGGSAAEPESAGEPDETVPQQ